MHKPNPHLYSHSFQIHLHDCDLESHHLLQFSIFYIISRYNILLASSFFEHSWLQLYLYLVFQNPEFFFFFARPRSFNSHDALTVYYCPQLRTFLIRNGLSVLYKDGPASQYKANYIRYEYFTCKIWRLVVAKRFRIYLGLDCPEFTATIKWITGCQISVCGWMVDYWHYPPSGCRRHNQFQGFQN